jgi:tyramine---L-glutamate ligase
MRADTELKVLVYEWVTGGGLAGLPMPNSWAAQGAAMRRAVAADFARLPDRSLQVIVPIDARLPQEPGPWTIVPIHESGGGGRLADLAQSVNATVVIVIAPETKGTLAALTRQLDEAGADHLGSSVEAVALTGDKARLAAHLRSRSIDTPPTKLIDPRAGMPADAQYPAVVKPVDGVGSQDTFLVADSRRVPSGARSLESAVLQPFVPGQPMSASFLVDTTGRAWLIGMGTQRMAVRRGRLEYRGGTLPVVCRLAECRLRPAIEAVAGLRGFVGVDFVWDTASERVTLLEINPRPTTSYVALSRLLPPGQLATAWLAACDQRHACAEFLGGLANQVHSQPRLSFQCDGVIVPIGVGGASW